MKFAAVLLTALPLAAEVPLLLPYQGRITVETVNPTGPAEFKFLLRSGPTDLSFPALAKATVENTKITSITVTEAGAGYVFPPEVMISDSKGTGSGAVAVAVLAGSKVDSIQILNAGADYTGEVSISIAPPPPTLSYRTLWKNDGTAGPAQPASAVSVSLEQGMFHVVLGDPSLMEPLTKAVFEEPAVELRVWIRPDGEADFVELLPQTQFHSAPYAAMAKTVPEGAVGTLQLAPRGVSSGAIAPGTVNASHLNTLFTGSHFAPGTLAAESITPGSIDSSHIGPNAIFRTKIADGAITTGHLADGVVDVNNIPPGTLRNHPELQRFFTPTP